MEQLTKVFTYGTVEVRTVLVDGDIWFVAIDVCSSIGVDPTAVRRLDDDEKNTLHLTQGNTRGNPNVTIVNESGLYSLILGSRKPEARAFKRWITHEVIPTIRKTGGYVASDDVFIETYLPHADGATRAMFRATLDTVRKQNEKITEMTPKAEAFDTFISADGLQSMNEVAKALGWGRNKLFAKLRERGVLMKNNTPYQRYVNDGYFTVKETTKECGGRVMPFAVTRVTPKGVAYIERLVSAALPSPTVESLPVGTSDKPTITISLRLGA